MPWVRIDDGYADHPKIAAVGPLGQALWFAGLAFVVGGVAGYYLRSKKQF